MLAICTADEPMAFKAPNSSSQTEKKDPKGKKPKAKTGRRKKSTPSIINNPSSKIEAKQHASLSKEATESQAGHSNRKESDSTTKADPGKSAPKDLLSQQQVLMMFTYDVPEFISDINGVVGGIKKYVEELKVEILDELKVLPEKLEEFQSSISVLTNKVAALENLKLDLLAELLALPGKVSSIHVQLFKLKMLDAVSRDI
ncbi:hypothetical protein Tco_1540447 [Tanacetum coccineum]